MLAAELSLFGPPHAHDCLAVCTRRTGGYAARQGPEIARRGKLLLAVSWSNPRVVTAMLSEKTDKEQPSKRGSRPSRDGSEGTGAGSGHKEGLDAVRQPLDMMDIIAALRQAVTDENKNVDPTIIQALLDDRRMPFDHDGNPTLQHFPFQVLPIPPDPRDPNAFSRLGNSSMKRESTDDAWRTRLASRFPSSWSGAGFTPEHPLGLIELLLWSILDGRHELALLLWKRSDSPLRFTLLCAQMYAELAEISNDGHEKQAHEARADQFEQFGVQMLSECREATAVLLLEGHTERWEVPVMDLAISGGSKAFVAHEHCQVHPPPSRLSSLVEAPQPSLQRASASERVRPCADRVCSGRC